MTLSTPLEGSDVARHPRQSDIAFCRTLLPRVSRTFALSIEALPDSLRDAVRTAYLLCRVVDTIEDDSDIGPADRVCLFDQFEALMADEDMAASAFERLAQQLDLAHGQAEAQLCQGAGAVFGCYRALPTAQQAAIGPSVLRMSEGMRLYTKRADAAGGLCLRDLNDLERYCYFVAGTVGELLTALFEGTLPELDGRRQQAIRERAVSFGLGLQLVNIVKDVSSDYERGDCYLPEETARELGLSLSDVLDPRHRQVALQLIGILCRRARGHLERACEYTSLWPLPSGADVRLFCLVPLILALATLTEVETGDDTLRPGRTPKISREAVARVLAEAGRAAVDEDAAAEVIAAYRLPQARTE